MAQLQRHVDAVPKEVLAEGETVVLAMNPSRRYFLAVSVLLSVLLIPVPAVVLLLVAPPVVMLYLPPVAVLCWLPYLTRPFRIFIVTDRRVIKRTGLLAPRTRYTPVQRIQDLVISQGLLQRILGCGSVRIASAGTEQSDMIWDSIDRPYEVVNEMREYLGFQV